MTVVDTVREHVMHNLAAPPSIAEVDWAEQNLGSLRTDIEFSQTRAATWESFGHTWRSCGFIRATLGYRFRLVLYTGATTADLSWLQDRITDAREGKFINHGWEPNGRGYLFRLDRPVEVGVSYLESHVVVPCNDPRCAETSHLAEPEDGWYRHRAETIEGFDGHDGWNLEVIRQASEPTWKVAVECDGDLTPNAVTRLVSDLLWANGTAKKLNAVVSETERAGSEVPC